MYEFRCEDEYDAEKMMYVLSDSQKAMSEAVMFKQGSDDLEYLINYWDSTIRTLAEQEEYKFHQAWRGDQLVMYGVAGVFNDRYHQGAGFYRSYEGSRTWTFSREFWLEHVEYCKTLQTNRISADVKKLDDNNEQTPHWAMLQLIPQRINLWMTTEDTEQDNVGRWTMYFNETIYQELNPHLYD